MTITNKCFQMCNTILLVWFSFRLIRCYHLTNVFRVAAIKWHCVTRFSSFVTPSSQLNDELTVKRMTSICVWFCLLQFRYLFVWRDYLHGKMPPNRKIKHDFFFLYLFRCLIDCWCAIFCCLVSPSLSSHFVSLLFYIFIRA